MLRIFPILCLFSLALSNIFPDGSNDCCVGDVSNANFNFNFITINIVDADPSKLPGLNGLRSILLPSPRDEECEGGDVNNANLNVNQVDITFGGALPERSITSDPLRSGDSKCRCPMTNTNMNGNTIVINIKLNELIKLLGDGSSGKLVHASMLSLPKPTYEEVEETDKCEGVCINNTNTNRNDITINMDTAIQNLLSKDNPDDNRNRIREDEDCDVCVDNVNFNENDFAINGISVQTDNQAQWQEPDAIVGEISNGACCSVCIKEANFNSNPTDDSSCVSSQRRECGKGCLHDCDECFGGDNNNVNIINFDDLPDIS